MPQTLRRCVGTVSYTHLFRPEHQISAGKINAALTEASQFMGMRAVRGVDTIARFVSDNELRCRIAAVSTAVQNDFIITGRCFIQHLHHKIRIGCFILIDRIQQLCNIKGVGDNRSIFCLLYTSPHFPSALFLLVHFQKALEPYPPSH